jgi:hypothetical protein
MLLYSQFPAAYRTKMLHAGSGARVFCQTQFHELALERIPKRVDLPLQGREIIPARIAKTDRLNTAVA